MNYLPWLTSKTVTIWISAFQVAGITGMSLGTWLCVSSIYVYVMDIFS
jgi:hypothetical protein